MNQRPQLALTDKGAASYFHFSENSPMQVRADCAFAEAAEEFSRAPYAVEPVFGLRHIAPCRHLRLFPRDAMVVRMSRYHYETVTEGFAILVPSSDPHDRWVSHFSESKRDWQAGHTAVRAITSADLGRLSEIFRPEELPLVVGVADLQRAINKKDEAGFWLANEKVRPWQRQRNMPGVTITYKAIGRDWGAAQSLYADLMNELTQNVRLILWQPERGQLRPALYCPDLKTAKFVLLLMGRIRVCPKCKEIFRPKKGEKTMWFFAVPPTALLGARHSLVRENVNDC